MSIEIRVPNQESRMSTGYELEDHLEKVNYQIDVLKEEVKSIDDIRTALEDYDISMVQDSLKDYKLLDSSLIEAFTSLSRCKNLFLATFVGFRNDLETRLRGLKEKARELEDEIEIWISEDNRLWDSQERVDNTWFIENEMWSA